MKPVFIMNSSTIIWDFDIASFFVMLSVAFYSFTRYSEESQGNRAFKRMIFCALLYSASDFFFSLLTSLKAGNFFQGLFYSLCCFFFIAFSQTVLAYTNAYVFTKEQVQNEKALTVRRLFPILAAALVLNLFTGFLFFIDDVFSVAKGPAFAAIPLTASIFSFASVAQLGRNAQKFNKAQIITLCILYETTAALPFIQAYICPNVRIAAFIFAVLTTTLLLAAETPDDQALLSTISELEELQRALKLNVEKKTNEVHLRREKIERLATQMMRALVEAIDAKDRYTSGHSERVARYSKMLAQKKALSPEKCQQIYMMGLLHDIGKIGVSSKIINKTERLTDIEYAQMKRHPIIGSMILEKVSSMPELRSGARWHHERVDGRGYPDGLDAEKIPLEAKIIAVADAYDAMTSSRSYRKPFSQEEVREQIVNGSGSQFDVEIASLMTQLIDEDTKFNLHEWAKTQGGQK